MDGTKMLASMIAGGDLSFDDVLAAARQAGLGPGAENVPTVKEFYKVVETSAKDHSSKAARGGGLFRTYEPYFKLLVEGYPYKSLDVPQRYEGLGDKLVTDVTKSDLIKVGIWAKLRAEDDAKRKAVARAEKGRWEVDYTQEGAYAHFFGATRFFFNLAVGDRLLTGANNPTNELTPPKKSEGRRRALDADELAEVWKCVQTGGNDPELDTYLFLTALITGCRREGLINLRLRDLDRKRATVWLREKSQAETEQPCTVELIDELIAFAERRGATNPNDTVFAFKTCGRYPVRRSITDRRFDTIHERIQTSIEWCDRVGFTIHWIRHHATTQMRVLGGDAVAEAFARHAATSVTRRYDKARPAELLAAFNAMTGTTHPLTDGGW